MLPSYDPWDIEALIENSMINAREVIDLSDAEEVEQAQIPEQHQTPMLQEVCDIFESKSNPRFSLLSTVIYKTKVQETYRNHRRSNICFNRNLKCVSDFPKVQRDFDHQKRTI